MREFIDKTAEQNGTPLNRDYLMAIQGFDSIEIKFNQDGSLIETNSIGETKTTRFLTDGSIEEIFEGENIITKTTRFNANDTISVVIT